MFKSLPEAMNIIGGLSQTSKMPWYSWSISALDCNTGSKLRQIKGSVCASCYACKGCYVFKVVKDAHQVRMEALAHPDFVEAFVFVLKEKYKNTRKTYLYRGKEITENRFRWFDSGDLQSQEHLDKIIQIAEKCPEIRFWMPTKEARLIHQFVSKGGTFPKNLTVRLSHPMVGETFKVKPKGVLTSTVGYKKSKADCPAYDQGNQCLNCDRCWDKSKVSTNYPLH